MMKACNKITKTKIQAENIKQTLIQNSNKYCNCKKE